MKTSPESTRHYTPEPMALEIARMALNTFSNLGRPLEALFAVDPSCGHGALLDAMLQELAKHMRPEALKVQAQAMRGWDLDSSAIEACREKMGQKWGCLPEQFQCSDFLALPWHERSWTCVVANPPFLGGSKISGAMGVEYYAALKRAFPDFGGTADYATCFLRSMAEGCVPGSVIAMIAPKSLHEGDSRKQGPARLIEAGWVIVEAKTKQPWPGKAQVLVNLVTWVRPYKERQGPVLQACGVDVKKTKTQAQEDLEIRELVNPSALAPKVSDHASRLEGCDKAAHLYVFMVRELLGDEWPKAKDRFLDVFEDAHCYARRVLEEGMETEAK